MLIYPTIELQGGRCVSLAKGRLDEPMLWHVDPVETARGFAAAGAEWMHVTDFDGLDGSDANSLLLEDIIRAAGIPVQIGGGFRSRQGIERWIDKGAARIVVSTVAAQNPELVREVARAFPDQIVIAVDVRRGQVMIEGWRKPSAFAPDSFISAFDDLPLAGIIVTDIDSDESEVDAQLGLISDLASKSRNPIIASGVVRSLDDISRLKYVPNISGAIVGRALMNKSFDLGSALETARPEPEPVAEFR